MQQLLRLMTEMSNRQPQLKGVTVNYDFTVVEDGFIRSTRLLNAEIDDKGRPKKLNPDELAKAKGDSPAERRLAGYKAEFDDVQVGDEVVVTLAKQRPTPPVVKSAPVKTESPGEKAAKATQDKEENDEPPAPKKFALADWKAVGTLRGVVTAVDGNRRLTLRVNTQQWVMPQPNGRNGAANHQAGQPRQISIDSDKFQATVVLIIKRSPAAAGAARTSR
jgi:hypothetical protein